MQKANTYVGIGILNKERHILSEILKQVHHSGSTCRIPEVAETFGIGRTNIYEMIATGVLPTIRVGRAVRITDIALQKWVEACVQQDVPIYKNQGQKTLFATGMNTDDLQQNIAGVVHLSMVACSRS
jgi:excisionase family DNA binding protein